MCFKCTVNVLDLNLKPKWWNFDISGPIAQLVINPIINPNFEGQFLHFILFNTMKVKWTYYPLGLSNFKIFYPPL